MDPSTPAFFAICLTGFSIAFLTILTPTCWSGLSNLIVSKIFLEYNKILAASINYYANNAETVNKIDLKYVVLIYLVYHRV